MLQHYEDTIERLVVFDEHADLLAPSVLADLHRLFPDGRARMWGVVPGKRNVNVGKVARLRAGDFVLFYGSGRLYLAGTVVLRWHNAALAKRLWGFDKSDVPQTWEHMYALTDVRQIDVPIQEVRLLLEWKPKAVVQGFNIYHAQDAEGLRELCNLAPAEEAPVEVAGSDRDAHEQLTRIFDGPTDGERASAIRLEQPQFKKRLNEIGRGSCALCGRVLPPGLLVGAHIKKRSKCTEDERRDFDNVGMLACLLGCDGLFERGYIAVGRGGELMVSTKAVESPEVTAMIQSHLQDRVIAWWTENREKYFEWHRTHVFLKML
ncbi:hypothetical protein [Umezawaea sp. NPDC059074]|uniref:hypothetical protein n=1 Tax=Umezawaea sp. NPDC059074 TaxID=3346716 RepID=UPI0036B51A92